jgi:tetratricopeptide (TPR) repeat protein
MAQQLWEQGQQQAAIDRLLLPINAAKPAIPRQLGLQLVYYIFQLGDLSWAELFLRRLLQVHPDDLEILENLALMLGRQGKAAEAAPCFEQVVARSPGNVNAWDGLAASLARLERFAEARAAGERSLALKTKAALPLQGWQPPAGSPQQHLERPGRQQLRDVIAFSIWGSNPRYLRGALRNALLIPDLYPGWQARFHLDTTVPLEFRELLQSLGAEVRLMPAGQSIRQKLCWRFQVANDPAVGRFLVRDCDSVVNQREVAAVQQWLASERWFHVMRDWWSHTDPILAGMWGGVAGVLPDLTALLSAYKPPAKETANVDQWFLRDLLWGSIRPLALVHDRCFRSEGSVPWPTPTPSGKSHVGQDEFAANRKGQALWLAGWLQRYSCLQISGERTSHVVHTQSPAGRPQGQRSIDLREVRCRWISLERDSAASRHLEQSLRQQGFEDLDWCPGVRLQESGSRSERMHAQAVALAHKRALELHLDDQPLLLLEDDVATEADANWTFAVPADADAVWVGISRYGKPIVQPINPSLSRIERMFSTHAVLYLSKSYKEHAMHCAEQCNSCWLPFDIGLSFYQKDFNVYALNQPAFFQANGKGQHNFEALTRGSLLPSEGHGQRALSAEIQWNA